MITDLIGKNKTVLLDGSMGAMLIDAGIKASEILCANITAPQLVCDIQKGYADAGSDVILTNTFNMTEHTLTLINKTETEIIGAAVKCAQKASGGRAYIGLDFGPSGFMPQCGEKYPYKRAYDLYKRQIQLAKDDVDLMILESVSLIEDVEAFCEAANDACDLPIFACMTFTEKRKTWFGYPFAEWIEKANALRLTAAGLNCTLSPEKMLPLIKEFAAEVRLPVIAKPNRGQPEMQNDKAVYTMSVDEFAGGVKTLCDNGASIIGGCCGSDKECISQIKKLVYGL